MSGRIEWLPARFTMVSGVAVPGDFKDEDGNSNEVACIAIQSADGYGIVIEGRPDNLLDIARSVLRTAETLVEQTMRDPNLRSLYGITTPPQVGTEGE